MIVYDALSVPYRIAWDVPDNSMWLVGIWMTRIFWMMDLPLNFITGFHKKDGEVEMKPRQVAKHYLRTGFAPDLALVLLDWVDQITSNTRGLRAIRAMRLARGVRQLSKCGSLLQKAKLMINHSEVHMAMDISCLLLIMAWVNHIVACMWYVIGKYSRPATHATWLTNFEGKGDLAYEYSTVLHWAITQMTPGSMEVNPRSVSERLYAVCILFMGLLLGSSLIATITSIMTQYRLNLEDRSRKFMALQQFLKQQQIDAQFAMEVKLQVRARVQEKQRMKLTDVAYLNLTSSMVRDALKVYSMQRVFSQHTFLSSLSLFDSAFMRALAIRATEQKDCPRGDIFFEEQATCSHMFFLSHGVLRYTQDMGGTFERVRPGEFFSEAAVWMFWHHLGTMEAVQTSEIICLSPQGVQDELAEFPEVAQIVADYCQTFHHHMNQPGTKRSDLSHALDYEELMARLPTKTRKAMATPILGKVREKLGKRGGAKKLEVLEEEVSKGKCHVGLVGEEVVRTVFVIALRIRPPSSHLLLGESFLVQVGSVVRACGTVKPSCVLPGTKRSAKDQDTEESVQRVLKADLVGIGENVCMRYDEGAEQTSFMKDSPSYGIRTRYLRTTYRADLAERELETIEIPRAKPLPLSRREAVSAVFAGLRARYAATFGRGDRRRKSKGPATVKEQADALLDARGRVVVIDSPGDKTYASKLYLWLTDDEFQVLSSDLALPVLHHRLKTIDTRSSAV